MSASLASAVVGSWAAKALARSGVGRLTLIDHDDIAESNINRQIHSMGSTLEKSKVITMADRIADINPDCQCHAIDDFITDSNLQTYLLRDYDFVIDAIDSIRFKHDGVFGYQLFTAFNMDKGRHVRGYVGKTKAFSAETVGRVMDIGSQIFEGNHL